ncbi:DUF6628 family protein [Sphingomonas sp. 1P06PA]|uniref:DUF6628 family protein n=1 Tax=Sphingomonas sp. 1P06PA TaxID=554121 RepID=UPI0039A45D05
MPTQAPDTMLPHAAPQSRDQRLMLFAIRRIAVGGLDDAHAAHAFLIAFGRSFRRPLLLTRALMAEVSRVSATRILVAPCCCPRATAHEAGLLDAITAAIQDPRGAHDRLAAMLNVRHCLGAITSAQAVAQAFADLGRPIG